MQLDMVKTAVAFVLVVALGTAGLIYAPMAMTVETTLTMVTPSMVVFGLITLALGVAHGQYRAAN